MSEYKKHKKCRFCDSVNITAVVDLGKMPLAGGFLKDKKDFSKEKKYPLVLNFCKDCYLLQTSISINPDTLFKNYFYFSSAIKTLVEHFNNIALKLPKRLKKGSFIVEIGSNDGGFIKALLANGYKALGVDPARNVVRPLIKAGLPAVNAYFSEKVAKSIVGKYGKADAIYSFHSLAHIPDMNEIAKGIKVLLKPEGYLSFEVHYLGNLLNEMQYDMIYHEHLHYYSLLTLVNFFKKFDMEIFDVEAVNQRAGSMNYYIQNKGGGRKISQRVKKMAEEEKKMKLNKEITYKKFNIRVQKTKKDLLKTLDYLIKKDQIIVGYGASGRGTVVCNYCGLDSKYLKFVVDDAPAKQGKFMPGTHNPILSPAELLDNGVKYSVVFAWPFINEVNKRNADFKKKGGKFIVPLPKVKTL